MYRFNITIVSRDGSCELVDKQIKCGELEDILSIDLPSIYAEAQQAEIEEGLDIMTDEEYDERLGDFSN